MFSQRRMRYTRHYRLSCSGRCSQESGIACIGEKRLEGSVALHGGMVKGSQQQSREERKVVLGNSMRTTVHNAAR